MLIAVVALVCIIAGQQPVLQNEIKEYRDAKASAENVEKETAAFEAEKNSVKSGVRDEDIARAEGYVAEDETVFIFD